MPKFCIDCTLYQPSTVTTTEACTRPLDDFNSVVDPVQGVRTIAGQLNVPAVSRANIRACGPQGVWFVPATTPPTTGNVSS